MKVNKAIIKNLQAGIRKRAAKKLEGGEIIKVEAHPIPEHPRPRPIRGRVALVGDALGTVTKSSGEGIYFAAKSGRMLCGIYCRTFSEWTKNFPPKKTSKISSNVGIKNTVQLIWC